MRRLPKIKLRECESSTRYAARENPKVRLPFPRTSSLSLITYHCAWSVDFYTIDSLACFANTESVSWPSLQREHVFGSQIKKLVTRPRPMAGRVWGANFRPRLRPESELVLVAVSLQPLGHAKCACAPYSPEFSVNHFFRMPFFLKCKIFNCPSPISESIRNQ